MFCSSTSSTASLRGRRGNLPPFRWGLVLAGLALMGFLFLGPTANPANAYILSPSGSILLSSSKIVFSLPTLADVDGDGRPEILVGTTDGKAFALKYSSAGSHLTALWSRDTSADMGGCPTGIHGALSAGDLNGDGKIKVVVPIGAVNENRCGGLVVLDGATGASKWHYVTQDLSNNATGQGVPDGKGDPVVSTPALADIDNDGKLEIMFGAFDQHVYALRSDGTLEPGNWPVFVRDTVWSSAAIADLDRDGYPEIVIGADAHYEAGLPNSAPNGGCLFAFRHDGTIYWRQCINQVIYSSPAIGDLNGDGQLEIVHGTGEYYQTAAGQDAGYKIYVRDALGNVKWTGATGGYTRESPALGDINGDGKLEIAEVALDNRLYLWRSDGAKLWDVAPQDFQGKNSTLGTPVIAGYPGDTYPDAYSNIGWESAVLRGTTGSQLTGSKITDTRPTYLSGYSTSGNAPAIGDIDGDGKLELVLASADNTGSQAGVFFWRLNVGQSSAAAWPMFHHDARHTGFVTGGPHLANTPTSIYLLHQLGNSSNEQAIVTLQNTGGGSFSWSMALPQGVSANPSTGTTSTSSTTTLTISTAGQQLGTHALGNVTIAATSGSVAVPGSPASIPITLNIVRQLYKTFLPDILR